MTIPRTLTRNVIDLFAGPGGWDQGAAILGLDTIHGYDTDPHACATAASAGFTRTQMSVTALQPEAFRTTTGAIISPPCPTYSAAGKGTGRADIPLVLDALRGLGDAFAGLVGQEAYADLYGQVADPRSALVMEALRFTLRLPHVQWVVCEQVPAVAPIWEEMAAELAVADWESCTVLTVHGEDVGLASKRVRTFLIGTRNRTPDLSGLPFRSGITFGRFGDQAVPLAPSAGAGFPQVTMAGVLGWGPGERINTRGARKTSGGNEFSADGLSWCLTEKARSWKRVSDGARLTPGQAGVLVGFPADYPWTGARSRQFLQAADVVAPPVAAAILGCALGLDWVGPVREYLAGIYAVPAPMGCAA